MAVVYFCLGSWTRLCRFCDVQNTCATIVAINTWRLCKYCRQSLAEESLAKHLTWIRTNANKRKIVRFSLIIFPRRIVAVVAICYILQSFREIVEVDRIFVYYIQYKCLVCRPTPLIAINWIHFRKPLRAGDRGSDMRFCRTVISIYHLVSPLPPRLIS